MGEYFYLQLNLQLSVTRKVNAYVLSSNLILQTT
jgi:hypothetical protein